MVATMTTIRYARGVNSLMLSSLRDSAIAESLVTKVIDCCGKAQGRAGRVTVTPSAGDHCWAPADLDRIVAEVRPVLESGDQVLIHCNSGRSRSSTAAAAVLLAMGLVSNVDAALSATVLDPATSGICRTTPHRRAVQSLRDWWISKRQIQMF